MIELCATRAAATAAQAEQALLALENGAGVYFGVDAGIPGMHPLQATLIAQPALSLKVFGDGVEVQIHGAWGTALLALPGLAQWRSGLRRGTDVSPVKALRGFLACFAPSPDVLLLGALRFDAHRLAQPGSSDGSIGTLFFGERLLRRDATGMWEDITICHPGLDPRTMPPPARTPRNANVRVPHQVRDDTVRDDMAPGGYAAMVRRAIDLLREQPLVSLTLSQSYRRRVHTPASDAFARLRCANPAPASFFFNGGDGERLFGASPDLQLVVGGGGVQALPVCGAVARRAGAAGEAESVRELMNEEVDAASLAVCTDALRNDLAPLCEPGSLVLLDRRRPMALATVVHAVDRLAGKLKPDSDAWDAVVATAAPVMVTGTPRAAALAAIAQLEGSPRGWYGGMVVQVASNGDALAGTILRAACVRGHVAEVRTGGDLMADSSPEREEQESRLKTLSLWRAFGLEAIKTGDQEERIRLPAAACLLDAGDPFGAAVRACLLGLGLQLAADAGTIVLIGGIRASQVPRGNAVAIGDAALHLLDEEGFAVESCSPEHGRPLRCAATADAPWRSSGPFLAARYTTLRLAGTQVPQGWQVWAAAEGEQPVVLANAQRRIACLLFRPESLLSDPQALQVLRAALAFAAGARRSPGL